MWATFHSVQAEHHEVAATGPCSGRQAHIITTCACLIGRQESFAAFNAFIHGAPCIWRQQLGWTLHATLPYLAGLSKLGEVLCQALEHGGVAAELGARVLAVRVHVGLTVGEHTDVVPGAFDRGEGTGSSARHYGKSKAWAPATQQR